MGTRLRKASALFNGSANTKIIRQDRHSIEDLRCYLIIAGKTYPVMNYSTFGVAIECEQSFPEHYLAPATLKLESLEVCTVQLKHVRSEKTDKGFKAGFETQNSSINTERVNVICDAYRAINNVHAQMDRFTNVPTSYRLTVLELKEVLSRYEKKVKEFETQRAVLSAGEREVFDRSVIDVMADPIHDAIRECNLSLNKLVEGNSKDDLALCFDYFREQLRDLIYQSPFAERSYSKPLGYAGDFEMMNLIYRNEDFGLSLYGRCMERAMQMHMEPAAVRNRSEYLREKILGTIERFHPNPVRILSVASGPAFEVRRVIEELPAEDCKRVEFCLLDQDLISLKSAQRSILSIAKELGKEIKLKLINKPIRQVIVEGIGTETFDLIYSAGLFDYFSDSVANRAGAILFESLNEDGRLIIGNFATTSPNKFGMLTLFDWHLILRSEEDMLRLFTFEGGKAKIESEPNGVNLFCVAEKT